MDWKKVLMYGSFATGAVLFLSGKRPAGLAVAGIGLATLAAQHPEKLEEIWDRIPEYLDKGTHLVEVAADLIEQVTEQAQQAGLRIAGGD
jgi:hypothetical protein